MSLLLSTALARFPRRVIDRGPGTRMERWIHPGPFEERRCLVSALTWEGDPTSIMRDLILAKGRFDKVLDCC